MRPKNHIHTNRYYYKNTLVCNVCIYPNIMDIYRLAVSYDRASDYLMNHEYSLSPSRALQMPVDNSPVKSVFSVFSSTILLLTSLIFLDIRLSSISLSGQVSFGLLFSKSQFSDLVETPRLIYLVFLSLQTLILRGNSPFFNGLYLYQTTSTVIISVKTWYNCHFWLVTMTKLVGEFHL